MMVQLPLNQAVFKAKGGVRITLELKEKNKNRRNDKLFETDFSKSLSLSVPIWFPRNIYSKILD